MEPGVSHHAVLCVHLACLSAWTSVNDSQLCAAWQGSVSHLEQRNASLTSAHSALLHGAFVNFVIEQFDSDLISS